ncbi:MAG: hypothetical protein QOF33_3322, partial [Thermomicrobiales bacterium]|nr:hypothetical protein [Thermomicrobiales bacterium]
NTQEKLRTALERLEAPVRTTAAVAV